MIVSLVNTNWIVLFLNVCGLLATTREDEKNAERKLSYSRLPCTLFKAWDRLHLHATGVIICVQDGILRSRDTVLYTSSSYNTDSLKLGRFTRKKFGSVSYGYHYLFPCYARYISLRSPGPDNMNLFDVWEDQRNLGPHPPPISSYRQTVHGFQHQKLYL